MKILKTEFLKNELDYALLKRTDFKVSSTINLHCM
jgi:hypothetical protein